MAAELERYANWSVVMYNRKGILHSAVLQIDFKAKLVHLGRKGKIKASRLLDQAAEALFDAEDPLKFVITTSRNDESRWELFAETEDHRERLVSCLRQAFFGKWRPPQGSFEILKSGQVEKKGNVKWSPRWLVLSQTQLLCFKLKNLGFPVNVVDLITNGVALAKISTNLLRLTSPSRQFYFRMKTKLDRDSWAEILCRSTCVELLEEEVAPPKFVGPRRVDFAFLHSLFSQPGINLKTYFGETGNTGAVSPPTSPQPLHVSRTSAAVSAVEAEQSCRVLSPPSERKRGSRTSLNAALRELMERDKEKEKEREDTRLAAHGLSRDEAEGDNIQRRSISSLPNGSASSPFPGIRLHVVPTISNPQRKPTRHSLTRTASESSIDNGKRCGSEAPSTTMSSESIAPKGLAATGQTQPVDIQRTTRPLASSADRQPTVPRMSLATSVRLRDTLVLNLANHRTRSVTLSESGTPPPLQSVGSAPVSSRPVRIGERITIGRRGSTHIDLASQDAIVYMREREPPH